MCICAYHLSEFLLSFSKKSIIKIDISIVCVFVSCECLYLSVSCLVCDIHRQQKKQSSTLKVVVERIKEKKKRNKIDK